MFLNKSYCTLQITRVTTFTVSELLWENQQGLKIPPTEIRVKTLEMCDKAFDSCPFVFHSILDRFKTQKMCNKDFSEESFMLKYCLDRYKTQQICDKAVDNWLPELKFVPDWFA